MCDERGASAIAPVPVLPIRDVKLETSAPLPCELPVSTLARGAPAAGREAPPVIDPDAGARDAWLAANAACCPVVQTGRATLFPPVAGPVAVAHRPSVFRPPRP